MRIVFHGANAATFRTGIEALLDASHDIALVPDQLREPQHLEAYTGADVVVSSRYDSALPVFSTLRLFQVPGAGTDGIDIKCLPAATPVCNCFGHEVAIGEYVVAAMLRHVVPMNHADAELRRGEWAYWSARAGSLHGELAGRTIGLLGYGHIGKHIARLAEVFGMRIVVANRTPVPVAAPIAASHGLDDLGAFCAEADFIVCCLPHVPSTTGILDRAAFAAMRSHAVVINVGRGPVIDEDALFEALSAKTIGGAVIDTWYVYPPAGESSGVLPAHRPFEGLSNVTMTPHMSGWTDGMVARRRQTIATNINRIGAGQPLINCVRP